MTGAEAHQEHVPQAGRRARGRRSAPSVLDGAERRDDATTARSSRGSRPSLRSSSSCATTSTGRSTTDDFEDLTFDYTPEELGIDAANAAKIEEIKRLRPLVANQPWGIFFVKFEPKQLPVVALRRILNGVVVKKRATASAAEQQKWATDDLLFISNYGEGEERRISFAHFSRDPTKNDLPTLKVLALGRPGHAAASRLRGRARSSRSLRGLHPRTSGTTRPGENGGAPPSSFATAKSLRPRRCWRSGLPYWPRAIRDRIKTVLAIETEDGPVTKLMKAFQRGADPRPRRRRLRGHVRADDRLRAALGPGNQSERRTARLQNACRSRTRSSRS